MIEAEVRAGRLTRVTNIDIRRLHFDPLGLGVPGNAQQNQDESNEDAFQDAAADPVAPDTDQPLPASTPVSNEQAFRGLQFTGGFPFLPLPAKIATEIHGGGFQK